MRLVQADEVMAADVGTRMAAASGILRILNLLLTELTGSEIDSFDNNESDSNFD
jgi:hypothetical protein